MSKWQGIICILSILSGFSVSAQNKQNDSLKYLLKTAVLDSEKVKLLLKLSETNLENRPVASVAYGKQAYALAEKSNWTKGRAMAYKALAADYFELKKVDSSIYFTNMAALVYQQLNMPLARAEVLLQLGKRLESIQKYADAKNYFMQGLEIYKDMADLRGELIVLEYLGWLYHNLGNYKESNSQFKIAYTLAQKLKDAETLAHLNSAFGNNYIALRNYRMAQQKYFESADYFKKQGDLINYASYIATAANLYRRLNQPEKAEKPLLEAYSIVRQNNDQWDICTIARYLGMLYTDLGRYNQVESYLQESNQMAIKLRSNTEIIKAYYAFERFYYLRNDIAKGDKYQKLIISMRDSLYNTESAIQLAEFDVKYKTAEREKLLARAQLDIVQTRNWIFGISTFLIIIILFAVALWYIQKIKHQANLKDLSLAHTKKELQTREHERQRIAKDLHDSLGSQLTIVSTSLDNACFLVEKNRLTADKLEAINADVREAVQSLRDTIWATNQTTIRVAMLYARMQQHLIKVFGEQERIRCNAALLGDDRDLNATDALNLFRIFQEAIQNILKHAQASRISLLLESSADSLKLSITDNGRGFAITETPDYESFGLLNMKLRSEEINADLTITSSLDAGTIVEIIKKDST